MILQSTEINEVLEKCPRDKFKDLRGPVTISREFLAELERIDNRLVIRWQPIWNRYAVFCRMDRVGRLWHQPVHIVQTPEKGYRSPDSRDLAAIRKAHYYASRNGARAQIDALDKRLVMQDKEQEETRDRVLRKYVGEAARRRNMTLRDLEITARPFADNRRAARNLQGVSRRK